MKTAAFGVMSDDELEAIVGGSLEVGPLTISKSLILQPLNP